MIRLKDVGIEDCKRKPDNPDRICLLKINGVWNEYKMVIDEFDWLYVVLPLESGTYEISLLDIDRLLGRIKKLT